MSSEARIRLPGTPPRWVNTMMARVLRTPGLDRVVGRNFALITVTGAKSGRRYTTPVQPMEIDGEYVVLSQVIRRWWRNIAERPEVELLVRGRTLEGTARLLQGEDALATLRTCFERYPRSARFYHLEADGDGRYDEAALRTLLEHMTVIRIEV